MVWFVKEKNKDKTLQVNLQVIAEVKTNDWRIQINEYGAQIYRTDGVIDFNVLFINDYSKVKSLHQLLTDAINAFEKQKENAPKVGEK